MGKPTDKFLDEALEVTKKIAVKAGKGLLEFHKELSSLKVSEKKAQGVVSDADISTEKLITDIIKNKYPEHQILGEESSFSKLKTLKEQEEFANEKDYCWIIDPLDGTTNFLAGMDYFAVCISLAYKGFPVLGVVYRPYSKELFYATKGCGAFKKVGSKVKKLSGPRNHKFSSCVFATGFSSEKVSLINKEFVVFKKVMSDCRAIRRMGSAALDMCYVAEGIFDGFWERGLAPWDVAASGIICLESKVRLADWNDQLYSPFSSTIIGAKRSNFKELLEHLK